METNQNESRQFTRIFFNRSLLLLAFIALTFFSVERAWAVQCDVGPAPGQCFCHGNAGDICPGENGYENGHDEHLAQYCCENFPGPNHLGAPPECNFPTLDCSCLNGQGPQDIFGKCNGCGDGDIDNNPGCCDPDTDQGCTDPDNFCEECDDRNNVGGDGCDANCQLEQCGDGNLDPHEACDGEAGVETCESGNCTDDCQCDLCGNGVVDPGEQCDGGQCCDDDCTFGEGECDDNNHCTTDTTCQPDGTCGGGDDFVCADPDVCFNPGVCDPDNDPEVPCDYEPSQMGSPCDDEGMCNGSESCDGNGMCVPGEPTTCDDGNVCTSDSCDDTDGECDFTPAPGSECEHENICIINEQCDADGNCTGETNSCDDDNGCTNDLCHPSDDHPDRNPDTGCVNEAIEGCEPCDDDTDCDDENECTANICNELGQCTNPDLVDGTICEDDGQVCSSDICVAGECTHPDVQDGTSCTSDGQVCTNDVCNEGHCIHPPVEGDCCDSDDDCSDGNECTQDVCNEETGVCSNPSVEDGMSCASDGEVCTNDVCEAGQCTHPDVGGECCQADQECGDGNECTQDVCNEQTGECSNPPVSDGTECNSDNQVCTNDVCDAGQCTHPAVEGDCCDSDDDCGDDNECTQDVCNEETGVCSNPSVEDGTICEGDGQVCTNDVCDAGQCTHPDVGGDCCESDQDCDDGLDCTVDECNEETGVCSNISPSCGDGEANAECGEECDGNDNSACEGRGCNEDCECNPPEEPPPPPDDSGQTPDGPSIDDLRAGVQARGDGCGSSGVSAEVDIPDSAALPGPIMLGLALAIAGMFRVGTKMWGKRN